MRSPAAPGAALLLAAWVGALGPRAVRGQDSPHGEPSRATECVACHTPERWSPPRARMRFDHGEDAGFALDGRHASTACATCHIGLRFDEPRGAECAGCHADVHRGSLGGDCAACHDTDAFVSPPSADAHRRTSFPLTGAHEQLSCERCHVDDRGGLFSPLDPDCFSCHQPDYAGATLVDHVAGGYPSDCLECHTVVAWRQAPLFDHAARANGFELLGAHVRIGCEGCHVRPGNELRFAAAGQDDCVACHRSDYDREHAGSTFPTSCAECHDTSSWEGGLFEHDLTGFPLEGPHASLECEACHRGGGDELLFPLPTTPEDCVACHRADYDREHAGSGFPTTCRSCHSGDSWDDASGFDHAATGFELVGRHLDLDCSSCHRGSDNALLFPAPSSQTDCIACHRVDYDREHTGSGFSTDCSACHSTTDWGGADFDHDAQFFPIYSGKHRGEWSSCATCHTSASDFAAFSCLGCHEHRQSEMDDKHKGRSGYVYESTACLSCHPDGRKDG